MSGTPTTWMSSSPGRYLTGEEPEHIAANASVIDQDGRFNEVEENVSWRMKFPSGIVTSCNTTYGADMEGFYRVHGSEGWLEVDSALLTPQTTRHPCKESAAESLMRRMIGAYGDTVRPHAQTR